MLSDISVLIPWRGGDPQREAIWNYMKSRWEFLGVELCVGTPDDGPFNCAQALNRAFLQSTNDVIMQFGADCFPDPVAIEIAHERISNGHPWIPIFDRTDYYNEYDTALMLHGGFWPNERDTDSNLHVPFQTGVLAMQREVYQETGGADERFMGWGGEDSAFRRTLWLLHGNGTPLEFGLRCLWHDGKHRKLGEANLALCQEYERIHTRSDMLRYIAQRGHYV